MAPKGRDAVSDFFEVSDAKRVLRMASVEAGMRVPAVDRGASSEAG